MNSLPLVEIAAFVVIAVLAVEEEAVLFVVLVVGLAAAKAMPPLST